MQDDFVRNYPSLDISILGINEAKLSPAGFITDGRDLPWLVDVDANNNGQSDVWYDSWQIVYRDVVIVDRENNFVSAYNLTQHNLADPENLAFLKQSFIDVAVTEPMSDWQSPVEPLDVNGDGFVAPLDALLVINDLGVFPGGVLPGDRALQPPYVDTSGDGIVAPADALAVINHLNFISSLEMEPQAPMSSAVVVEETAFASGDVAALDLPPVLPDPISPTASAAWFAATDEALADDWSADLRSHPLTIHDRVSPWSSLRDSEDERTPWLLGGDQVEPLSPVRSW